MSTPSLLNIPYVIKAGTLYSQIPETGAGDFAVTRVTTPTPNRSTRINADGFIELVNDNVPRLDYPLGGAVNGCAALLVEPAATNSIRNNSMVGASAPNTLPTNWSNAGSGLTRQSVVTGTLNGIPYVDIRISGTANNTFHDVFWDASNIIAASVGQNWVASCYLQIIAQPNPPVSYALAMREFNSGGGFLGVFTGPALSISTTSFNRFSFTRALNQATVAFVHPSLFLTLVNGQTYDFTIRIGYPQMEIGSVATSVIPTTTAAITRADEVINKTGVSSLIGQTEGTMYVEFISPSVSAGRIYAIDNGPTITNRISIFRETASRRLGVIVRSKLSVTNGTIGSSAATAFNADVPNKTAYAYKSGDYALAINGAIAASGNLTFDFNDALSYTQIAAESGQSQGGPIRILSLALFPNRLTNAQLQALTTP
jgi:hypothetical protein